MSKVELQKFLVLPFAQVPHSGLFNANGKYDRRKTVRLFKVWKHRHYALPTITTTKLRLFLRTRGTTVRSGVERQEILDMCEQKLKDEAATDRAVRLYLTPYDDGAAEKRRRRQLIEANILTSTNAPGLVPPKCPSLTDPAWMMLRRDVLEGIVFPDVLTQWLSLFTTDFSSLLLKGQGAWSSGKAYAIKYQRVGEYLFVYARVGQSYSNATSKAYNVCVMICLSLTVHDLPNPYI